MRFQSKFDLLLLVIVLAASTLTVASDTKTLDARRAKSSMVEMPLVIPLFIQDQEFTSTLVMVNGSKEATAVDVILTASDGRQIKKQRVPFGPHSQRQIEVNSLLQSAELPATKGRIVIIPSPGVGNPSVLAQLTMTYLSPGELNYIDEEAAMPSAEGSKTLRAVADRAEGSPLVAVTSLSDSPQRIVVECLVTNGGKFSDVVELGAQETLLMEACGPQYGNSEEFLAAWNQQHDKPSNAVGVGLTSDATPGSFSAFGLARHSRSGTQFFSMLSFADPKTTLSSTTVFTGVPVGPATLLPEGQYVPELTLANFSDIDVRANIKYSHMSGEHPSVQDVATVVVAPKSTRVLSLNGLEGDPELKNSFLVSSDAQPGDLVAKLVATSKSRLHETEFLGKDERDNVNGGIHPWSIEQGTESSVLLFNHSTLQQVFNVLVGTGGKLWKRSYVLQSMETANINLRELVQGGTKDDKGNTLPADLQKGEVEWFIAKPNVGHGRLLQSNRPAAMARSFSCGLYYLICGVSLTQEISVLPLGGTREFGYMNVSYCSNPTTPSTCSGNPTGTSADGETLHWSSDNSDAQISGANYYDYVNVYGNSEGTSTITGSAYDSYYCGGTVSGSVQVVCPVPINYTQTSGYGDSNGILHFQYAWDSNTGNLADLFACTVREYVTFPGSSPYNWTSPPYVATSTPWPITLGGPATQGSAPDTHDHPGFRTPYTADSFTATQYYQYICTCANGNQPVNLMGPLYIFRSVSQVNGIWQYSITKSGINATTTLP